MTNYSMADTRILEKVQGMEIDNWFNPNGSKGWHTCLLTNKKKRGVTVKETLMKQEKIMAEIVAMIESEDSNNEEITEFKEDVPFSEDILGNLHGNGMTDKITNKLAKHLEDNMTSGKSVKMVQITCIEDDCNNTRQIKVQDKFQVKRCVDCQKKHRNKLRSQRRREKKLAEQSE
ncbi:hypothetical protein BpsS140_00044 [Bacillus phage vB_BpsS-140]|nr:hypothetical protein BpsS140_00044 [Bacillus phage vB_BpsS-140]